jgi:hypothetical protein
LLWDQIIAARDALGLTISYFVNIGFFGVVGGAAAT